MLKLKLKVKPNDSGADIKTNYRTRNTTALEHLVAIAMLWQRIKENDKEMSNRKIYREINKILLELNEEEENDGN